VLCVFAGMLLAPRPSHRALALLGIAGHAAGSVRSAQWQYVSAANRTWLEWVATSAWAGSGWLAYIFICIALARWVDGTTRLQRPASVASVVRSWGYGANNAAVANRMLGVLRFFVLLGAGYVCLALAYDGRGRDFPLALAALPIVGFALLELITRDHTAAQPENEERLLTASIALPTIYIVWHETWANTRAMAWCALCLLLVATLCVGMFRSRNRTGPVPHPHQGAEQEPHSTQLERI
jgi:hypothetical protein